MDIFDQYELDGFYFCLKIAMAMVTIAMFG
jgi:hypothetical protein